MSKTSPIIEFANILKAAGVGSPAAEQFKQNLVSDSVFRARATVLEQLFRSEDRVLAALNAAPEVPAQQRVEAVRSKGRAAARRA